MRNDEGVLQWFSHMMRMENDRIAKRVYVVECACSRSVGRLQKRWIDTVKDYLKKEVCMSDKQGEWCMMGAYGGGLNEPLTLMRCHCCKLPQLYEALEGWKLVCG